MELPVDDLDPAELLAALYNRARPLGLGVLHFDPAPMTPEQAAAVLAARGPLPVRFDYLKGRVMKVDIGRSTLKVALYDRDNGEGAAAHVVDKLRRG